LVFDLDKGVAFLGGGFLAGNLSFFHTVTDVRTLVGNSE